MSQSKQPVKAIPAKGVRGMILPFMGKGEKPVFRIYKHDSAYKRQEALKRKAGEPYDEKAWDYTDYEIQHYDFDVVLDEDHAVLYEFEDGRKTLDYPLWELKPKKSS